jgi:hypothetical protein
MTWLSVQHQRKRQWWCASEVERHREGSVARKIFYLSTFPQYFASAKFGSDKHENEIGERLSSYRSHRFQDIRNVRPAPSPPSPDPRRTTLQNDLPSDIPITHPTVLPTASPPLRPYNLTPLSNSTSSPTFPSQVNLPCSAVRARPNSAAFSRLIPIDLTAHQVVTPIDAFFGVDPVKTVVRTRKLD